MDAEPVDLETLDAAVRALLQRHPHALVAALNSEGICVAMPDSVPLADHSVLQVRSALDIVEPAERVAVIHAWEEAKARGTARASVRLVHAADQVALMQTVDARALYGVFLCIVVPGEGDVAAAQTLAETPSAPPRLGKARKNEVAVFLGIDEATHAILGWTESDLVGRRSLDLIHPDDADRAIDAWMDMLARPGGTSRVRLRHACKDGSWIWLDLTNYNRLDDPEHGDVFAEMIDISDEMAAHEALRAREQLLHRLAEALPIGLFQVSTDRKILYANERLREILDTRPGAQLDELFELFGVVVAEDRATLDGAIHAVLDDGTDGDVEVRLRRPARREIRSCLVRLRALTGETGAVSGAIVCVEDVTDSVRMRAELERRATFDLLTGCHNRASVMAAVEAALTADRGTVGAIFVDLDGFKAVNDELGHAAGDELLTVVAERLAGAVRGDDVLGRIGGDEFLVVCRRVADPDEALRVGHRIGEVLREPVEINGRIIGLRASVGVACAGDRPASADSLVAQADAAMYESKRRGAGGPVLYTEDLRPPDARAS